MKKLGDTICWLVRQWHAETTKNSIKYTVVQKQNLFQVLSIVMFHRSGLEDFGMDTDKFILVY